MLRRRLIILFIFFLGFFIGPQTTLAQEASPEEVSAALFSNDITVDISRSIPFYNCGLAGVDGRDACCHLSPLEVDENPSMLDGIKDKIAGFIPVYGTIKKGYSGLLKRVDKFQDDHGDARPCWYGRTDPLYDPTDDQCVCLSPQDAVKLRGLVAVIDMCKAYYDPARANGEPDTLVRLANEQASCIECASVKKGYYSSFGCIELTSFTGFISKYIFGFGITVAGIIALLCIIISSLQIQTSAGNAEKLQSARERMTACILGLLLIIFSVFILQLAGAIAVPGL